MSVYPYIGWKPDEKTSLWGTLGFGAGELAVMEENIDQSSDTSQRMAAFGGGYRIYDGGPAKVDLKAEFWTANFDIDGNGRHIRASSLGVQRGRLLAEVSRNFELENGSLAPSFGIALRQDSGDGLTGGGVEFNAGVEYGNGGNFSLRADVRRLLSYDVDGGGELEEWGISGAIILKPAADGTGPSMSLTQTLGDISGGVEQLWAAETMRRAAGMNGPQIGLRTDARFGYGFAEFRRFRNIQPYVQLSRYGETQSYGFGAQGSYGAVQFQLQLDQRQAPFAGFGLGAADGPAIELQLQWNFGDKSN